MKKIHLILPILVSVVVSAVLIGCAGGKVKLFSDGKSNYEIVVGGNASDTEKSAAAELQKYLEQMTGYRLPIVNDADRKAGGAEIVVGKTDREEGGYTIDREALGSDGFQIFRSGKRLVIAGGSERGTLYGVYAFLESLGCRFFATGVETVPDSPTISLSLRDTVTEIPAFEYRDVFWSTTFDPYTSVKLRLNGSVVNNGEVTRDLPEELGGAMRFAKPSFVHTFHNLVPAEEYFDEHPEYFSEINGKRTSKYLYSQLCLTNPDVLRITIDKVRAWLRADPEAKIISVSQDDSFVIETYCTCPACAAVDAEEGSHAGALLRFVNTVADSIREEFPDVAIETLAYQYSVTPPAITKPRDNVIIRMCTGGCNAHPIESCPNNAGTKNNITQWAKICDRLYIWDYTTNFAHYLAPFPNLNTLQPNAQFFAENSVKGVFEQGNYQDGKNGEFGELRAYMLAKLLWDPYRDIEQDKKEFMAAYYGSAAPRVQEYLDLLHGIVAPDSVHFGLVFNPADFYKDLISDEMLAQCDALWAEAKSAADDEQVLERVRRSELQYRYYKMLSGRGEFADEAQKTRFFNDCNDLGVTRLNEGANVPPLLFYEVISTDTRTTDASGPIRRGLRGSGRASSLR